ncbi:ubiquitin domain-containing protein DSK2a isoform X1 [Physcomitrium patens]|uniref:Uncharacterized protein n=1 Tax=Physcomitrium patens TaxID=3218 RepID=A0A2K1JQM7_PHYPA|nr:ubiquitin domain-containing protein DSK2a-like isoform X1 [Physcomitrium patens]PNR43844.1 hypothetical protein PHYPA_016227 [Physcomitrium patens]|eukprot:XP_024391182.1 ubiquitin domain-containing protein DSK2a-like isoform X1 [Physcomitrella patens]
MGGEPDGAVAGADSSQGGSSSDVVVVHVRSSNGNKFTVEVNLGATVLALKGLLVEKSEIPADHQRLIYKGRVLKDEQTLSSYGLQSDHTVHLVRGAPTSSTSAGADSPSPAPNPTSTPHPANPSGLGSMPGLGGMGFSGLGLGSDGGASPPFGMGPSEFQQVQQQLMQNPNLMREMMNAPAVQNLMSNPELMRLLIMSNPQMREIIDRNPDLAHILNDPGTLRQTLDAARNPELMREMMRNTDRAMSNIEASPEGFNMLRRMYETVQEPLLNAAAMGGEGANDMASNPFAAMMEMNGNAQRPAQAQGGAYSTGAATAVPNTAPLPNPWGPTPARAGQTPSAVPGTGGGIPDLGGLAGLGLQDLGMMGGAGGLMDPGFMQQMLQNPQMQQMMQGILSNPQYMNQIMNMQPQLQTFLNQNPQFRDMMQNPDFIRQMSSPENLQQLMQLQQAMMGQHGRQTPGQNVGQNPAGLGGLAGMGGGMNMDALLNMFGSLGSTAPSNPDAPPEQMYASQLSQLQEMGFFDTQENIRALSAVGGNIHAAVERLLGNLG